MITRLIAGLVMPTWLAALLPYALAVALAGGTYWYVDHAARVDERMKVAAEYAVAAAKKEDAAQKHFAERARSNAEAIAALNQLHAAELKDRDAIETELSDAWAREYAKNTALSDATKQCWPVAIVKELRR